MFAFLIYDHFSQQLNSLRSVENLDKCLIRRFSSDKQISLPFFVKNGENAASLDVILKLSLTFHKAQQDG